MRTSSRPWLMSAALAASGFGNLGCGATHPTGFEASPGGEPGAPGAPGAPAGPAVDAGFGDVTATPGVGCSADLQQVLDGAGKPLRSCPPDQGCLAGACAPACQVAAANKGSVGCDFVVATPSFWVADKPPCFAVTLANNWPHDAKITVSRRGVSYDASQFARVPDGTPDPSHWPKAAAGAVPASKVAVLFVSDDPKSVNGASGEKALSFACPVAPALSEAGGTAVYAQFADSTGRGDAWHITTDIPVTAYDILPYGGAKSVLPSAELLLPTTVWGKSYVAALPRQGAGYGSLVSGPSWGQVVASVDDTTVTILPTTSLPAGPNVLAAPQNQATTFTLRAGEFVQWQPSGDMTGSIVSADKPVAFNGGSAYLCLRGSTSDGGGCDSAHQMIPPVEALGSEYVAPPYTTRMQTLEPEAILYRIVGVVEGTSLRYDPPVAGAPAVLGAGQALDFEARGAFTVKSQDGAHPFYVGQHMTGSILPGGSRPATSGEMCAGFLGDEEYVNVLPPAQWLSRYVFFTDPTYATTNLVFVRAKGAAGFRDVDLDCLGHVSGWQPIGADGQYEIANADLVRGEPNGACANGIHLASSEAPFGLIVWGLDACSSYAYPAGGHVAPINSVVVPVVPR